MKEVIEKHINAIDEELAKGPDMQFRVELLKAKSTALLALSHNEPRTIKLMNAEKYFTVMNRGNG